MITIQSKKTDLPLVSATCVVLSLLLLFGTYPAWAGPNSSAGCALDMDYTTRDYDPGITTEDIDSAITANANDEIWIAVVAQNVTNLDTYQVEINFDTNRMTFIEGYEDNAFGGIYNLLKRMVVQVLGSRRLKMLPGQSILPMPWQELIQKRHQKDLA